MAGPFFRLHWNGDGVARHVEEAARKGINDVMAKSVVSGQRSHPGWRNRTGTAEGSVQIQEPAHRQGNAVLGRWGSRGVNYVIFLELKHGSFLRHSADIHYPSLAGIIKGYV